jgi:hypothetical protein
MGAGLSGVNRALGMFENCDGSDESEDMLELYRPSVTAKEEPNEGMMRCTDSSTSERR